MRSDASQSKVAAGRIVVGAALLGVGIGAVGGCGGEEPAGPDVRGLNLVDAKKKLAEAKVETTVHAKDGLFGVIIEENFVVCDIEAVSKHMVRLEVAKNGC